MKTKLGVLAFFVLFSFHEAASQSVNSYYLPQVANGAFAAGSFRTSFLFFNNSTSAAKVVLTLSNDAGDPFIITLSGLGTASEFAFVLPSGASRIYRTDGFGLLSAGAARITSTVPIGVSGIFTIYDTKGNFVTESGVGNSPPLTDFVIPVETGGNYSTGLALFNPNGNSSYTAILLDADGNEVARTRKDFLRGAHASFFLTGSGQLFPNIGNLKGSLVLQSSSAISAMVLRQSSSPFGFTSLPVISRYSTQTNMSLAQVANGSNAGGSFRTSFLLFSTSSKTANVTLELTKDDGTPFQVTIPGLGTNSTFNLSIQAGQALFLQTDGGGDLASGGAQIRSDVPIGATSIFTVYDPRGNFLTEAGVGDSPVLTQFTLPIDMTNSSDTGVAFFNPGTSPVTVELRLMSTSGENNVLNPEITIPANGHASGFVSQFFPGLGNVQGTLAVSSSGEIAALTLRQNSSPYGFTTLPVASGTAPGFMPTKTLLSQSQTGINATANLVVDQILPSGSRLSGAITGGFGLAVTARSGNKIYSGAVNSFSGSYVVVLPEGTYEIMILYSPLGQATSSIMVYTYPQIPVFGNTTLDLNLPAPNLSVVSGSVSGADGLPAGSNPELVFVSNDNTTETFIPIVNGTYEGSIPTGSYAVSLRATNLPTGPAQTENLNVFNIGTVSVYGNTAADFSVPPLVTLSGFFSAIKWTSLGGSVTASDTSGSASDPFPYLSPPKTSSAVIHSDPVAYQMLLAQDRTYNMRVTHTISDGTPTAQLGSIYFPVTIGTVDVAGNTSYNFSAPDLPGQITISGRVVDSSGAAIANTAVSAYSESLTGALDVGFGANSTTDSNGNYSFNVLSGTDYQISFEPPLPMP